RRRKERDQDLLVRIGTGPLYFSETKKLIWTNDFIHLLDHRARPQPHDIRGKGMEMELLTEAPPASQPGRKPKGESITGVKSIVLHSSVDMHLYLDSKSGFLSGPQRKVEVTAVKANGTQDSKVQDVKTGEEGPSHIHIRSPGRFRYDILKDHDLARFDVPD